MNQLSAKRRLRLSSLVVAAGVALVFGLIWGPWVAYNWVPEPRIDAEIVEQARRVPEDALLSELGSHDLNLPIVWSDNRQLMSAADGLLEGRIDLPGFEAGRFTLPIDAAEVASGSLMWQLFIHGLGIPRVLLNAYAADPRPEYLRAAADYIIAYDAYEATGWRPGGFLWKDSWRRFVRNDHAIAARASVIAEFWRQYRRSPDYRPEVAAAALRMAARCGYLLADPARFTVATNHGVMQNIALCNVALSFPVLPGVASYCPLAFRRLDEQLAFFVNDEGFVLEHSPGYQSLGLSLLGLAFRYLALLDQDVPASWLMKYQAAQEVYAALRRPDGSLPAFGDTGAEQDQAGPLVVQQDSRGRSTRLATRPWAPVARYLFAPIAGYAVWWDGIESEFSPHSSTQTAIAWSNFEGMGHKHADELSVAVWANGTSWLTNVGYWPYDAPGRHNAESWEGSNAPHLAGERFDGMRKTQLRYYGSDGHMAVIDLERLGPDQFRARRQVIHVGPRIWIVIDTTSDARMRVARTIWTTSPDVQLAEVSPARAYVLSDAKAQQMKGYFDGAQSIGAKVIKGSLTPFGGWSVLNAVPRPAFAIVQERPADGSWALAAWSLSDNQASGPVLQAAPRMQRWVDEQEWELVLPTVHGTIRLLRHQGTFELVPESSGIHTLEARMGSDVSSERANLRAKLAAASRNYGMAAASRTYGTSDMSGTYRLMVTIVLVVGLLGGLFALRVVRRYWVNWAGPVRLVIAAGWLLVGYYFIFVRATLF